MKAVADTLAVARSNLIERVSRRAKSRRPYRKAGDDELLALIRRLVDERPTYGYRRIRRLINRQRKANGKPPVNGKRVLRIMQANKLTLERHTGRRPGRTHDGVVIALRSNAGVITRGNAELCVIGFGLACSIPTRPWKREAQQRPRARQNTTNRPRLILSPTTNPSPKIGMRSISIISCWPKTTANGGRGGKPSRSRKPATVSSYAGARNMLPTSRS